MSERLPIILLFGFSAVRCLFLLCVRSILRRFRFGQNCRLILIEQLHKLVAGQRLALQQVLRDAVEPLHVAAQQFNRLVIRLGYQRNDLLVNLRRRLLRTAQ